MKELDKKVNKAIYFINNREYAVTKEEKGYNVFHSFYDQENINKEKLIKNDSFFKTIEEKEDFLKWFDKNEDGIDCGEF